VRVPLSVGGWCIARPELLIWILAPTLRSGAPITVGAMKMWIEQPGLRLPCERIVCSLSPDHYRFRRISPVIFICGGLNSKPRDTLRNYLRKQKNDLQIFYAERVWELISSNPGLGALKMEADLAALSDLVVIIVESPGTFAELGAFSHVEALRKKLLPIVDLKYKGANSFINTGPIRWIDEESDFRPAIWTRQDQILDCAAELESRINTIPKPKSAKVSDLAKSRKHLLFFICDLVAVIAPTTVEVIGSFMEKIAPSVPIADLEITLLVGLAEAMGLLRKDSIMMPGGVETIFFSPAKTDALQHPYHRIRWVNLPELRAEFISGLLTNPEAVKVIREVSARR